MPYSGFHMKFMRQVVTGEKKLLKAASVGSVSVPRFREFSIEKLYGVVKQNKEIV